MFINSYYTWDLVTWGSSTSECAIVTSMGSKLGKQILYLTLRIQVKIQIRLQVPLLWDVHDAAPDSYHSSLEGFQALTPEWCTSVPVVLKMFVPVVPYTKMFIEWLIPGIVLQPSSAHKTPVFVTRPVKTGHVGTNYTFSHSKLFHSTATEHLWSVTSTIRPI